LAESWREKKRKYTKFASCFDNQKGGEEAKLKGTHLAFGFRKEECVHKKEGRRVAGRNTGMDTQAGRRVGTFNGDRRGVGEKTDNSQDKNQCRGKTVEGQPQEEVGLGGGVRKQTVKEREGAGLKKGSAWEEN